MCNFPQEIEKPIIKELTRRQQVIDVVLYGNVNERSLKVAAEQVRDDLRNSGTISQVELSGIRADEISIEVSESDLRRYGLSFDTISSAVKRTSLDLPAGSVESQDGEILIRTQGLMRTGAEYEDVAILTQNDGTILRLGEISKVRDTFEDNDLVSRFNGKSAAVVQVYRTGNQSALEISAFIHSYVKEKRESLPHGISIDFARDDARILRGRMN